MNKLLQFTTYGIKNIEKSITIDFANSTIQNGIKNLNNVKAIYGYNGAGKSAIITAAYLYKELALLSEYILGKEDAAKFDKLINHKTNEFYVSMVFTPDNGENIFKHEIKVKRDLKEHGLVIEEEAISRPSGRTLNEKFRKLIVKKGIELTVDESISKLLPEYLSGEKLRHSSITSLVIDSIIKTKDGEESTFEFVMAKYLLGFILSLEVYLSESDKHHNLCSQELAEKTKRFIDENSKPTQDVYYFDEDKIDKDKRESYEIMNRKLEKFIRLFKPSLQNIKLVFEEKGDRLAVKRYFVYENDKVSLEFESSGIKQIVQIFPYLNQCANGSIVFIDEIDTNIHSIYLEKLVSFYKEYGEGQLVFTTHNLATMDALKDQRKSLVVLGEDNEIDTWTKWGNRAPASDYAYGNFENSPMNIEDFDFINVFFGEI